MISKKTTRYQLLHRYYQQTIRYLYVQLFITCASLPILLAWGLPISLALPIGNMAFSPILFTFLFLSSLIFFTELLYVPNYFLVVLLEYTTSAWAWIPERGTPAWLLELPTSSYIFLCLIPFITLLLVHHRSLQRPQRAVAALTIYFCCICFMLRSMQPTTNSLEILYKTNKITTVQTNNTIIVVDPGLLGQRVSAQQWVEYTLIPTLVKQYGRSTIDHLIVLQPTTLLFATLEKLAHHCRIKNIYIPLWQGTPKRSYMYNYHNAMNALKHQKTTIHRLSHYKKLLNLEAACIHFLPLEKPIKTPDYTHQACLVTITAKNLELSIKPLKYA
jgi:hypothetical protein